MTPTPKSVAILPEFLAEAVARRIGFRAARLRRKFGLSREDEQDLRQDFWACLVRAAQRFDPTKSPCERYILMVLNARYKHHVRERTQGHDAQKPATVSLEELGEPAGLVDPAAEAPLAQAGLSHDVEVVLQSLTSADQRICRAVMTSTSPHEAAARLGVYPSTVYRAMKRLRQAFMALGEKPAGLLSSNGRGK